MTVSSAFTISRRTESFCFSRRRICIGECEWVPPLKSLRSARSRPESNRNVDETSRRFAPYIHLLGTRRGRVTDKRVYAGLTGEPVAARGSGVDLMAPTMLTDTDVCRVWCT